MRTDFLGGAYVSRSQPLSAQTLVNLFYEPAAPGSAEQGMFYGAPGLALVATLGTGPVRGLHSAGGFRWAVSGNTLYRDAAPIATIPGTGRVCIIHNDTQLTVMHSAGWTVINMGTLAISLPANAPLTAQGAYQDSYEVFPNANGTYGWSAISDASSIDALDFASAEAQPDPIISVLSDHRELWLFGETSTEIAQTSGDADLVFTRTAIMEHGCVAKYSPAKADNTVFWLGRDDTGRGVVFRAEGYSPSRVSTFALETAIAGYADISNAWGYCYQQNGHTFYVLTFDEATWAYDASSQRWSQLAYRNPASGLLERHRGNAYCFHGGQHIVGDYATGNLYKLDLDTYSDNGAARYWERTWSVIESEGKYLRHDSLQIMAEMGVGLASGQGSDPVMLLTWSDDGCRTFSNNHVLRFGAIGRYRNRAIARRLGMSRNRVYRLHGSDPVKVALYGANLQAYVGSR